MAQAHTATFEDVFDSSEHAHTTGEPVRVARWWSSWESWVTLSLIALAQLPVIGSLQSSDWVPEMPSLVLIGVAAITAGWLLAQSRLHGAIASLVGVAIGVVGVTVLILQQMPLTDPTLGTGWPARWAEFSLRMEAWFAALWHQAISADALPFVVLLAMLVYLVGFLSCWAVVRWQNAWAALVPGGIILLTNISYLPDQPSLGFKFFLVASVLIVTRMEFLRAAKRWRREHIVLPDYMSLEVMFIGVLVACVLVAAAWIVPTADHWGPVARVWDRAMEPISSRVEAFGQLFVGINSKRQVPVHSFGPSLPLQGKIVLGAAPLLHVSSTEPGNLRGAVYDQYTGAGWKLTDAAAVPLSSTTVQAAEFGTQRTKSEVRHPVTVQVQVVTAGVPDRRLMSVGDPLAANVAGRQIIDQNAQTLGVIPDDPATVGKSYTTVGTVSAAAVPTLLAAGTAYPPAVLNTYTTLPASTPKEITELAQRVAGNARTPYEAARRIESYLRGSYSYTLDPPPAPPTRDAVAAFLFDQRAGYFDQFASAMAVMLRSLGIPARVATGFVLDPADVDQGTKAYTVSELRAWSWPEVYFPNLGWVEFNPTPSRPTVTRPGDDTAALADADAAKAVDPNDVPAEASDADFSDGAGVDLAGLSTPFLETPAGQFLVRAISTLLVLSMVAVIVAIVARVLWQRHFRGLSPAAARWAKVYRLAMWAGIAPPPYLTVVEGAEQLGMTLGEIAAMRAIATAYTRDCYGPHLDDAHEDEQTRRIADRDYRRLRDQLRRKIVSRLVHLGRVPDLALPRRYAAGARASVR